MNESMIFIDSKTKALEAIPLSYRLERYSELISSVMMNLELTSVSLSTLSFECLQPIMKEMQMVSKKEGNKGQSEPIDNDTQLIIHLYESMDNMSKKQQSKDKCPIRKCSSLVNGMQSYTVNIPFILSVNQIILSMLNQGQSNTLMSKINQIKTQKTSSFVDEFDWAGKTSNLDYLHQLFNASHIHFRFSNNEPFNFSREERALMYKSILFFFYFFPLIFNKVTSITIDFNVYQLLNYYRESKDPYSFFMQFMEEDGLTYDYLLLASYLSVLQLRELKQLVSLKILIKESYIIETQSLIRNKDSIFFLELFHLMIEKELDLAINSLDPLLFKHSIDLLLINKRVQVLSIDLFPVKPANYRKMCFNALYYNRIIQQNDQNFLNPESTEDLFIDYVHINDLNISDKSMISDDKLVKYLFIGFNSYLKQLSFVLEILTGTLDELTLRLNLYPELLSYDSYNASVSLFLFNIFLLLNNKIKDQRIERLTIAFNGEYYETLIQKTMKSTQVKDRLGLNLPRLKYINLSLSNIRTYLSFEKFPYETIETLILNKLSYDDFTELVFAMKTSVSIMTQTKEIKVSLNYYNENVNQELIGDFFHWCLPINMQSLKFELPYAMSLDRVYQMIIKNILLNVKHSISNKVDCDLYVSILEFEQLIGKRNEIGNFVLDQLNSYFKQRHTGEYKISSINYYSYLMSFNVLGWISSSDNDNNLYTGVNVLIHLLISKCKERTVRGVILRRIVNYINTKKVSMTIYLKSQSEISRLNMK